MYERVKWNRPELKNNAKVALKPYYWWAVLASLICGVLCGNVANSGSNSGIKIDASDLNQSTGASIGSFDGQPMEWTDFIFPGSGEDAWLLAAAGFFLLLVALIGLAIGYLYVAFVANPISVGHKRFYMENRFNGGNLPSGNLGKLFYVFSCGNYKNVVKTMFLHDLYIFLWSLLFIIPGIVKAYEYLMVPYLLAENPNMPPERALQLSKEMMSGRKWDAFVFDLSFFGWRFLASLVLIGHIFVTPYVEASFCEMYLWLRGDALYNSYAYPQELNGLFMNPAEYRE